MDHAYIEEHNLVARYEMGKLSAAESARFEEHFVDCAQCQAQLTAAQDFRQGLRTAVAADPSLMESKDSPSDSLAVWRWGIRGAAACLVSLTVLAGFLARETRQLNHQLNQANSLAESLRHQFQAERETNLELQKQMAGNGKMKPGQNTPGPGDLAARVPVAASIFPLTATRSGEPSDSEPVNVVVITAPAQSVVFSLDLDQSFSSYRAALSKASGEVLWKASQLSPPSSNTLGITVPSGFLHKGDYLLTLEGLTPQGTYSPAGHYSFRVKFKQYVPREIRPAF